jgi:hypothetical protein
MRRVLVGGGLARLVGGRGARALATKLATATGTETETKMLPRTKRLADGLLGGNRTDLSRAITLGTSRFSLAAELHGWR